MMGNPSSTRSTNVKHLLEQVEAEGLPEQKGEEVHSDDEKEYSRGVYRYPLAPYASHSLSRQA
jgi:hypothetical protein